MHEFFVNSLKYNIDRETKTGDSIVTGSSAPDKYIFNLADKPDFKTLYSEDARTHEYEVLDEKGNVIENVVYVDVERGLLFKLILSVKEGVIENGRTILAKDEYVLQEGKFIIVRKEVK